MESTRLTKKQELILLGANIVVVSSNQQMKFDLSAIFKKLKWNNVKYVNSPSDFYRLSSAVPFDLVLIDQALQECGAVEFAKTLDRLHGVPIGFIGNIETLIDTTLGYHPDEQLFAFGLEPSVIANEIEDLVCSIVLPEKFSDATGDLAYCKMHIDDFISGKMANFDLYIRLARDRYIKIANRGESIALERSRVLSKETRSFSLYEKNRFLDVRRGDYACRQGSFDEHHDLSKEENILDAAFGGGLGRILLF